MIKFEDLSNEETETFNIEFETFIHNNYPPPVAQFFTNHRKDILNRMPMVKGDLALNFGGAFPNAGQFGLSFPQPQFFNIKSWTLEYKDLGWQTLVDLNLERSRMLLFGFYNMGEPKESHLTMRISGRDYPVLWLNELKNLHIYELSVPAFIQGDFAVKLNIYKKGTDELTPLGIYFGSYPEIYKKDVVIKE